jgi:AAA family ATP:ADP antiporter
MKARLLKLLDIEHEEFGRVGLLLIMSVFMGIFLATLTVASQTLFLQHYENDLPLALLISGGFGVVATIIYNFLQNRIPFRMLASASLITVAGLTAFIEFGKNLLSDPELMYFLGFTQIIPFSFVIFLVFWGSFGRLFNLRQSKRLVGTVDLGAMLASFVAYFTIPLALSTPDFNTENLYSICLISIVGFFVCPGKSTI